MLTVRIEHPVMDFDLWKKAFDADPAGRERSGVTSYRVQRGADDPSLVTIDLDFSTREQVDGFLSVMNKIWESVQGTLIGAPTARVAETIEEHSY